jgi:hypothetical protein
MLRDDDRDRLTFILNGLVVPPLHDRVIRRGDRLLVSYGPEGPEELLEQRFPSVPNNAPEFDTMQDPAGCAGTVEETFGERLRRALWF